MAKKVIEVEVQTNIPNSINQLKELKKELKNVAAGSKEFDQLSAQIRDLDDTISDARKTNDDFLGQLENAPGPLGMLGQGIRGAERTFSSFNGALKASIIGIIVLALGGLYKAFSENETAMKKIQPLLDGIEKAFSGVFRALEPVFNALVDMAVEALPVVTTGIGLFYSAIVGLFTYVKEAASGYINLWKGILTLDFDKAKEGVMQMKDSFASAVEAGQEAYKRFESGSKEQTKGEKESAEERRKNEEAAEEKRKEAREKSAEKKRQNQEKEKEDAKKHAEDLKNVESGLISDVEDLNAKSEQEKLDLQAKRELDDILAKSKAGDDIMNIMKLYNEKYSKLDAELQEKLKKENEDKSTAALASDIAFREQYYTGIKTYVESKNIEEIESVKQHQQLLLDEQERAAIAKAETEKRSKDEIEQIRIFYDQKELDNNKVASDRKLALAKEEADKIQAVDDAVNAAKRKALDTGLEILATFFSKNKAVALSILAIQKGLAIADVVVGASKSLALQASALGTANTAAAATPQAIATSGVSAIPVIAANTALAAKGALLTKITAGTSIASILAAGITSATSITSGGPTDTGGGGGGAGGAAAPTPPSYNVVGASPTNLLTAQAMQANSNQTPIKTYVVANDVTSAQALERNIITSATIG